MALPHIFDLSLNFKVIGLTRLGLKLKSTTRETDDFTTRSSEWQIKFDFFSNALMMTPESMLSNSPVLKAIVA